MAPPTAPPIKKVADVIRALQRAKGDPVKEDWGSAVFLVGAGCSVSAGIPLGADIAADCAVRLVATYSGDRHREDNGHRALVWLQNNGHVPKGLTLTTLYGTLFQDHYQDPIEQKRVIRDAIKKGGGRINWAHLCLGQLVRSGYVNTVLTTNFDQLVLDGVVRTGLIPVVADGIESLNRIRDRPDYPQVVHLHGSMHTYHPRNSPGDVQKIATDAQAVRALSALLLSATVFVIVGYAGGEEGVMTLLTHAAAGLPDKVIYWVQHGDNPDKLSLRAVELLDKSQNAGLIVDQEADAFFHALMQGLGLGMPGWIREPIAFRQAEARLIAGPAGNEDVRAEITRYAEELDALSDCLDNTRASRDAVARAVNESRAARMAGNFQTAFAALSKVGSAVPAEEWFNLGVSAVERGEAEAASDTLEIAVSAFQQALPRLDRVANAENWATTQHNLGAALATLGNREEGTARLKEAVAVYRAALEVRTRDRLPLQWAMTRNNLGNVLQELSKREEGTARLDEAIAAYRAALEVRTRDSLPLEWAMTQNNLGTALQTLGECEEGTARLEEAVAAYRAALGVFTRDRLPLQWATTQNNLGNALETLGEREEGTARLEEAIAAYRAAMEVRTRDSVPLDWAMTQNNLGTALNALGGREEGTARLEEAVAAHRAALEVFETAGATHYATGTRANLARVESLIAARRGN